MLTKQDFTKIIRTRGMEYYKNDMVSEITNAYGYYYARINDYDVYIKFEDTASNKYICAILDNEAIDYGCTCPCNFNCKHLYALLLKIREIDRMDIKFQNMEKKQLCKILTKLYKSNFHNAVVIKLSCDLYDIDIFKKEPYYDELDKITKLLDHLLLINPKQIDDIEKDIIDKIHENLINVCKKFLSIVTNERIRKRDELTCYLHIFSKILHLYVLDDDIFDDILNKID